MGRVHLYLCTVEFQTKSWFQHINLSMAFSPVNVSGIENYMGEKGKLTEIRILGNIVLTNEDLDSLKHSFRK